MKPAPCGTLIGALALAAVMSALAAEPPAPDFKGLDGNGDGRISLDESRPNAELRSAFETLDRNADGYLSAEEFALWAGARKPGAPTKPVSPETAPGGSAGSQHMPKRD